MSSLVLEAPLQACPVNKATPGRQSRPHKAGPRAACSPCRLATVREAWEQGDRLRWEAASGSHQGASDSCQGAPEREHGEEGSCGSCGVTTLRGGVTLDALVVLREPLPGVTLWSVCGKTAPSLTRRSTAAGLAGRPPTTHMTFRPLGLMHRVARGPFYSAEESPEAFKVVLLMLTCTCRDSQKRPVIKLCTDTCEGRRLDTCEAWAQ